MFNNIIKLGYGVAIIYVVAIVILLQFDNEVFDLPNHKLIISGGSFHLYSKKMSYTFEVEK